MADKVTTTKKLILTAGYADATESVITLDNPRDNLTASDLASVTSGAADCLISKDGAAFQAWKSVKVRDNTHTDLDLTTA